MLAAAAVLVGGDVREAWSQAGSGLPLPPGNIVTGQVFKPPSNCAPFSVPSITTGADANAYIITSLPCTPTPSFVANAPAAMAVTTAPTQYVRFYCPTCSSPSFPNRPFMADPSTVRGLTPAQIQNVLALPAVPTMETIVTVPTGSCVLVAKGAPAFGGTGGTAQEWAAGTPTGPNCGGLQFLPQQITSTASRSAPRPCSTGRSPAAAIPGRPPARSIGGLTPRRSPVWISCTKVSICSISAIRRRCARRSCNSTERSTPAPGRSCSATASICARPCSGECANPPLRTASARWRRLGQAAPGWRCGRGWIFFGFSIHIGFRPCLCRREQACVSDQSPAADRAGARDRILGAGGRRLGPA